MKNYLNRMAVMTLALTLAVCVPLAVGAEEGIEDVNVQDEDMILTEIEVASEAFVEEIPAVPASVRVSPVNLGSCEYFGDRLSLRANLENADGSETVTWQMCTNYVAGGNNAWIQIGSGSMTSVNITPAIGQCAYRCVLSTGAVSNVYRVSKTFAEKPEETVETIEIAAENDVEAIAEVLTEAEETTVENRNAEEVVPGEIAFEEAVEEAEIAEVEYEAISEDTVSFEDEFEFEDEEWLEFDDNDWGESDRNFFAALDDLANSNNEEENEETENETVEDAAEETVETVETDVVTVDAVDEEKTNEEMPADEPAEEEISGDNNATESEGNDEEQAAGTETEEAAEELTIKTEETEENEEAIETVVVEETSEEETENQADVEMVDTDEDEEKPEIAFEFVDMTGEATETDEVTEETIAAEEADVEMVDTDEDEEKPEIAFEFVDMTGEATETDEVTEETIAAEETDVNDEIAEEDETTEEAEQAEVDPMNLINSDRSVSVSFQWESEDHVFGEKVLARATLSGYENVVYKLQWQHSKDGLNYTDVSGATGETLEFVVTEDNYMDYWQVKVVIVAVKSEN